MPEYDNSLDYSLEAFWQPHTRGPMAGSWTFHVVNRGRPFELAAAGFSIILPDGEILPLDHSSIGPGVIYGRNTQLDFFDVKIPGSREIPVRGHTELIAEIRNSPPKVLQTAIQWKR